METAEAQHQIYVFTTNKLSKTDRAFFETAKCLTHIELNVQDGRLYGYRKANMVAGSAKRHQLDLMISAESHYLPMLFTPTLWIVHDVSSLLYPQYFYENPKAIWRYIYKFVYRAGLKATKGIITTSKFTKTELEKHFKVPAKKITAIGAGVNDWVIAETAGDDLATQILSKWQLTEGKYILSLGTINPRKNIERLLRAYTEFLKSTISDNDATPIKLVVAGKKGWLYDSVFTTYEELKSQYPELNLAENIVFTDFVSDTEAKVLTQKSMALIYPSLYEGFGLPPLEALLLGKEVALSDIAVFKEIYGEAAHYFSPEKDEEIAETLQAIAEGKKLNSGKIRNDLSVKYNWETTTTNLLKAIDVHSKNVR